MMLPSAPSYRKCAAYEKFPSMYDLCPLCGNNKHKQAKSCNTCRLNKRPFIPQPSDPSYRFIPLTKGYYAIVDIADYEWINQWRWHVIWNKGTKSHYAIRTDKKRTNGTTKIYMHRQIMGLTMDDGLEVDHIENGKTLDNRRSNLRVCTPSQNKCNVRKNSRNTSGFKGVDFHKGDNKFRARINVDGKGLFLGERDTAEAAWRELYVPAALKHYGEFARLE